MTRITQDSFPSVWGTECDQKRVKVEVGLPPQIEVYETVGAPVADFTTFDPEWITIPTTSVEEYITKDGVADLQRTVKVTFPTEWGNNTDDVITNNVREIFTGFNPEADENPFTFVRVWYRDDDDRWVLTHHGFAGGIGPTATDGESKVWVYDFAELLDSSPVNATYNDPSVSQVMESVVDFSQSDTFVPLIGSVIVPPEREDVLAATDGVTDEIFSAFGPGYTTYYINQLYMSQTAEDFATEFGKSHVFTGDDFLSGVLSFSSTVSRNLFGIAGLAELFDYLNGMLSVKNFKRNHDTLKDILDWVAEKTQSIWHLEPVENGVILVLNIVPERRRWTAESVADPLSANGDISNELREKLRNTVFEPSEYIYHDTTTVIENNSLYELNPVNTVNLRGSAPKGFLGSGFNFESVVPGSSPLITPVQNEFPVVKVQIPSLVEAAEGVEVAPRTIESDATTLGEAEAEARTALRKALERVGEGEIVVKGSPRMMPYDYLDAFEVCNGYIDIELVPVRYEIETVRHTKTSEGWYETTLTVSIAANERLIETVTATMENLNE